MSKPMTAQNNGEFCKIVGCLYEGFDPKGYTSLSLKAELSLEKWC
ncbi:MAG: hypothetical protein WBE76_09540 [Terracidiphilus sp.]